MIPVEEASARILARIEALPGETIATANAAHRVLAGTIAADLTSPPWDNSSMDGYAVRSADLSVGTRLRVVETVAAGSFPSRALEAGEATRVMTGAPVPERADSVIRREDTDDGTDTVTIHNLRDSGRNIRLRGEDFTTGDTLFDAGTQLGIAHLGVLASAGIKHVIVHRRPVVAIISSGDELVPLDDFEPEDKATRIVSSNSVSLAAAVRDAGGIPLDLGIARDDEASIREKLGAALDADLIVTSAGISAGDHDHVRTAFATLGGSIEFWKVRMRPGAPLAFGFIGGRPWIGMSGNPVTAIVSFELFVRPVIRRLLGLRDLFRTSVPVRISEPVTLAAPLMHFLRAVITPDSEGTHSARLAGSQSSAVLTALARANALLVLPGDSLEIAAGELHRAIPVGDGFGYSGTLRLT
jgi:molybdopterin molybdotransferase